MHCSFCTKEIPGYYTVVRHYTGEHFFCSDDHEYRFLKGENAMICFKCKEPIAQGDACITEPLEWGRYHYYHPECHHTEQQHHVPITRAEARRMLGPYPNERR